MYLYAGKKKKGGKSPGRTLIKSPSKRPKTKNYVKKVGYVCRVIHNSEWTLGMCCVHVFACMCMCDSVGVGAYVHVCVYACVCVGVCVCVSIVCT